jgi:hypothetical protein
MRKSLFIDEVFSGYEPRQVSVLNRCFKDHLRSMMMRRRSEMVLKTPVQYRHLMWLIAQEDFIEFSHHKSSRT